jgi:prepilin-type processing-associated H-X9-DG protein/prepilin-type N-terminal cleavage/methylation domain-containing protein
MSEAMNILKPKRYNQKIALAPFTLLELLIVIGIIAILSTILLPSLQGARERGRRAVCASNMKQISTANFQYLSENSGKFQDQNHLGAISWEDSIYTYLGLQWTGQGGNVRRTKVDEFQTKVFQCPTDPSSQFLKNNFDENVLSTDIYSKSYAASERYEGSDWYPGVIGGIYPEWDGKGTWAAKVTMPSQTLLFSEMWNYDQAGNKGSANNLLGGTVHNHSAKYAYYNGYKNSLANPEYFDCHGGGKANMVMVDGHVEMMHARKLVERVTPGIRARGTWFDHGK